MVVHMSFIWCHGTSCHKNHTTDRVRGVKGSKVLRTKKIKQHYNSEWYRPDQIYNYFCSQNCLHDFIRTHIQRVIALDPRNEPLETRIEDPEKVKHTSSYGSGEDKTSYSWYTTTIKKVDTITE